MGANIATKLTETIVKTGNHMVLLGRDAQSYPLKPMFTQENTHHAC